VEISRRISIGRVGDHAQLGEGAPAEERSPGTSGTLPRHAQSARLGVELRGADGVDDVFVTAGDGAAQQTGSARLAASVGRGDLLDQARVGQMDGRGLDDET